MEINLNLQENKNTKKVMSDSVTKYFEMIEEGRIKEDKATYIYESPDGGKTIRKREFLQPKSSSEVSKQAYNLLCEYDEEVILQALKILLKNKKN